MNYNEFKIISNQKLNDEVYKMVVENNDTIKPGQFYMLKLDGQTLLPRPISICEKENNETITFVYAVVGKATNEYKKLVPNDKIKLIGPLGNGFRYDAELGKVALVSGGIGTAPMLELSKYLKSENKDRLVDVYAGFRDDIYLINDLAKYVDNVNVSTNSGKHGHKGFVTDILDVTKYDTVLCCGPEVMMKRVVDICKENNVKVYVSMEKHMACGVGACLVCTCKTKEGNKRTCKDGPVFEGSYIEF